MYNTKCVTYNETGLETCKVYYMTSFWSASCKWDLWLTETMISFHKHLIKQDFLQTFEFKIRKRNLFLFRGLKTVINHEKSWEYYRLYSNLKLQVVYIFFLWYCFIFLLHLILTKKDINRKFIISQLKTLEKIWHITYFHARSCHASSLQTC